MKHPMEPGGAWRTQAERIEKANRELRLAAWAKLGCDASAAMDLEEAGYQPGDLTAYYLPPDETLAEAFSRGRFGLDWLLANHPPKPAASRPLIAFERSVGMGGGLCVLQGGAV